MRVYLCSYACVCVCLRVCREFEKVRGKTEHLRLELESKQKELIPLQKQVNQSQQQVDLRTSELGVCESYCSETVHTLSGFYLSLSHAPLLYFLPFLLLSFFCSPQPVHFPSLFHVLLSRGSALFSLPCFPLPFHLCLPSCPVRRSLHSFPHSLL